LSSCLFGFYGGSLFLHLQPDPCRHAGVVQGAVAPAASGGVAEEVPVNGSQLVVPQAREAASAHFEGADVPVG